MSSPMGFGRKDDVQELLPGSVCRIKPGKYVVIYGVFTSDDEEIASGCSAHQAWCNAYRVAVERARGAHV